MLKALTAVSLATLFVGCGPASSGERSASGAERLAKVTLEVRKLINGPCDNCFVMRLPNAFTETDQIQVENAAVATFPTEQITAIEFLMMGDERSGKQWTARVGLTPEGEDGAQRLTESVGPLTLVLVSVNGRPADVVLAGQIGTRFLIGGFRSLEEIRQWFGASSAAPFEVVLPTDPAVNEIVEKSERDSKQAETDRVRLQPVIDAIRQGDRAKAERLLKQAD